MLLCPMGNYPNYIQGERIFWIHVFLRLWNDAFIDLEKIQPQKFQRIRREKQTSIDILTSQKDTEYDKILYDICENVYFFETSLDHTLVKSRYKYLSEHPEEYRDIIKNIPRKEPNKEFENDLNLEEFFDIGNELF